MTESKAIKIIKEKVCDSRCIPQLCNDGCMYENTKCAFSMAIQALEKQIAKKPKKIQILTYIFALCVKEKLLIITLFIAQVAVRN